jgi:hypothetical protein
MRTARSARTVVRLLPAVLGLLCGAGAAHAATTQKRYYAHDAVEDRYGVIAPWYQGQNGIMDLRVRVAAEFLKRYPWVDTSASVMAGPHWVFNPLVNIDAAGQITVPPADTLMNGDLGQRFKYITESLPRYYRYSGDPVVFGYLKIASDFILDNYLTAAAHPWPQFPISVPNAGTPYGRAAPGGLIQLDLSAGIGLGLLRAYQLTGEARYLAAARHVGDVFAAKCNHTPGAMPWTRYDTGGILTGGVANILIFLDELIRLGDAGENPSIIKARDAGRAYLADILLPRWTINDTWGRHYWDTEHPVQGILPTGWVVQYLMDHPDVFPDWPSDVRNILGLYINHACVSPESNGDVYSGAWAYPESCGCCGRSLDACPLFLACYWARYGETTDSAWAREIARRKTLLSLYHFHETGMVEDNIDGGQITAREWSEIIGMGPLFLGLEVLGWLPEVFAPPRENHIVNSSATVTSVVYDKGRIEYTTGDAPTSTVDVLRLAFVPSSVRADGRRLRRRGETLHANGYTVVELPGGDALVRVRHDGLRSIVVTGRKDPQEVAGDARFIYEGAWTVTDEARDSAGKIHVAAAAGAAASYRFEGNQVRLIGRCDAAGGLADVYLDGAKQLVGIDCWAPGTSRHRQVLYYRNGLSNAAHELRVVARGQKNSYSQGTNLYVDGLQWSAAAAENDVGSGGGPTGAQRLIFGYPERRPYVDSAGNSWVPGTEFVVRCGNRTDSVATAWWTQPVKEPLAGTPDPELYRYGVHAPSFWVNLTVGPGTYGVRLRLAERRAEADPLRRPMDILINGQPAVAALDVAAKAGGTHRAVDLTFDRIAPVHGIIEIRFVGTGGGEAIVQALELLPQP